jgi:hypothetical protein
MAQNKLALSLISIYGGGFLPSARINAEYAMGQQAEDEVFAKRQNMK